MLIGACEGGHHTELVVVAASEDGGEDIPFSYGIGGRAAELKYIVLRTERQLALGDAPEEVLPLELSLERLVLGAVGPVDGETVGGAETL